MTKVRKELEQQLQENLRKVQSEVQSIKLKQVEPLKLNTSIQQPQ